MIEIKNKIIIIISFVLICQYPQLEKGVMILLRDVEK